MGVRVNPKIVLVKDQMINRYREGETKFSDKVYLLKNEAFIETFKSVVNFFFNIYIYSKPWKEGLPYYF